MVDNKEKIYLKLMGLQSNYPEAGYNEEFFDKMTIAYFALVNNYNIKISQDKFLSYGESKISIDDKYDLNCIRDDRDWQYAIYYYNNSYSPGHRSKRIEDILQYIKDDYAND